MLALRRVAAWAARGAAVAVLLAASPERRDAQAHGGAPPGFTMVEPGGDTGCAFATPYRFFARLHPASPDLLIYFEGGGACWNGISCSGMFDPSVSPDELAGFAGIFDGARDDNPFADFSILFVPYCTGDVHVGNAVGHYGTGAGARPVQHAGARNVAAALAWLGERRRAPRRVVVAGASAGAYGALFHAPAIARRYPHAALTVIEDSGVPLLPDYSTILERWGAPAALRTARGLPPGATVDLTLEGAHAALARAVPGAHIAHITSDRDAIQSAFYLIAGSREWRDATYALLDTLDGTLPRFHHFVVSGADHGLMRTDAFYQYEAGGERLRDWIAALVAGRPSPSRRCAACDSR